MTIIYYCFRCLDVSVTLFITVSYQRYRYHIVSVALFIMIIYQCCWYLDISVTVFITISYQCLRGYDLSLKCYRCVLTFQWHCSLRSYTSAIGVNNFQYHCLWRFYAGGLDAMSISSLFIPRNALAIFASNTYGTVSLRKHAYSNKLKFVLPKILKFSDIRKFWYFSFFAQNIDCGTR